MENKKDASTEVYLPDRKVPPKEIVIEKARRTGIRSEFLNESVLKIIQAISERNIVVTGPEIWRELTEFAELNPDRRIHKILDYASNIVFVKGFFGVSVIKT